MRSERNRRWLTRISTFLLFIVSTPPYAYAKMSLPTGIEGRDVDLVMRSVGGYPDSQYPYYSSPNGCGTAPYPEHIRDTWGKVSFTAACQAHDKCYMTGDSRGACDDNFYNALRAACEKDTLYVDLPACYALATTYYGGVAQASLRGYFDKQQAQQRRYEDKVMDFMPQIISASKPVTYQVIVKTGDKSHAGTDATVYIRFNGEYAFTPFHSINNPSINDFVRGTSSAFLVSRPNNVGRLQSIVIKHNGEGNHSGWFLESVEVVDRSSQRRYFFPFNNWLDNKYSLGRSRCALLGIGGPGSYLSTRVPTAGTLAIDTNEPQFAGMCPR
jgi:hypothetical protein